jgi:hypothetical protein
VAKATRKRFYGDGDTPYTPSKESPKFWLFAGRRIILIFLLDTPQCARNCGVFPWLAVALI